VLAGVKLKELPPKDWAELVRELSTIGNNINQIARVANTVGTVDQSTIDELLNTQSQIWQKVKNL